MKSLEYYDDDERIFEMRRGGRREAGLDEERGREDDERGRKRGRK